MAKSSSQPEATPDQKPKNRRVSDWPKVLQYLFARLIDNGLGALLILGATVVAVALAMTYGMNSADRKETILAVLGWPALTVAGWFAAFAEFFIFRYVMTLKERTHDTEIKRMAKDKNEAIQAKFPFELQSSEEQPKTTE